MLVLSGSQVKRCTLFLGQRFCQWYYIFWERLQVAWGKTKQTKLKIQSEVTQTGNKRNYLYACSSMLEKFPWSRSTEERQSAAYCRHKNNRTTEWKFFPKWIQHWIEQKGLNKALTPSHAHNYLPNKQKCTQVLEQDLHFKVLAYFLKSIPEKATRDQCPNLSVHSHVEGPCNVYPSLKWRWSMPKPLPCLVSHLHPLTECKAFS